MILGRFGISLLAFCLSMIFSDLPSPAEAPAGAKNGSQGFAQTGKTGVHFSGSCLAPRSFRTGD
jgi:hypothetical protein